MGGEEAAIAKGRPLLNTNMKMDSNKKMKTNMKMKTSTNNNGRAPQAEQEEQHNKDAVLALALGLGLVGFSLSYLSIGIYGEESWWYIGEESWIVVELYKLFVYFFGETDISAEENTAL